MHNSVSVAVNAVLPMFLLIGSGYLLRRMRWLDTPELQKFNMVGFRLFLPCHLFMTIYRADFQKSVPPEYLALIVVCVLLIFLLSVLLTIPVKDAAQRGVMIQGVFRSNFILIGIPLVTYLCGEESAAATSAIIAVIVPLFNVLAVTSLCVFRGEKIPFRKLLKDILTTPLIVGSIFGFSVRLLHIPLDRFPALLAALDSFSQIATPLLLFILGASFQISSLSKYARQLSFVLLGRLVLAPFLAISAGILMGFRGLYLAILLAVFGSPCASSSYTLAQQMGGDKDLASGIVVAGTALSCFTMSIWIVFLKQHGLL